MTRPVVNMRCAAGVHDQPDERTLEVSFPGHRDAAGLPLGALINLRNAPAPSVSVYRVDAGVRVVVPQGVQLQQHGLVGRVVDDAGLAALLAVGVAAALADVSVDAAQMRALVVVYALDLPPAHRATVTLALRDALALRAARGADPTDPDYNLWRLLLARLEAL